MHWRKITLVGVGLLGGSLGQAIRQRRLAGQVAGYVRRAASIAECKHFGAADQVSSDLAAAVTDSDLVILCTPIAQMGELSRQMLPVLKPGTLITDVGSVKGSVVQELEPLFRSVGADFIGSHPMAGAEKMGVSAAHPDLFVKAVCIITPTADSSPDSLLRLEEFWSA